MGRRLVRDPGGSGPNPDLAGALAGDGGDEAAAGLGASAMTLGERVLGIGMVGVAMVCQRLAGWEGQGKDFAGIHNMSGQTQTRPKFGPNALCPPDALRSSR